MGIVRDRNGVCYARKKVPARLGEAVAMVLGTDRPRVAWLKRSLRTRDQREANITAKPVLMEFDAVLAKAAALLDAAPVRSSLSEREIERIAQYHRATMLSVDDETRREGTGSEDIFQAVARQLEEAGVAYSTPFHGSEKPAFGLSDREMERRREAIEVVLPAARHALARGDIGFVQDETGDLLDVFSINLDRNSESYRKLAMAVLRECVSSSEAVARRNSGEVVEAPRIVEPDDELQIGSSEFLTAAFEGWKKAARRTTGSLAEFGNAIRRFVELQGDLPLMSIKRRHVREFREALQAMPVRRSGALRYATLPELVGWSQQYQDSAKVSAATVNKLLGGVQAVVVWGRDNGFVPEDVLWADPFSKMRLEEEDPAREPWEIRDLRLLFNSPIYSRDARPKGGCGEAAYWLPLLGLFTGARLGELAQLVVGDVTTDASTRIPMFHFKEDEARGTRLKTRASRRIVPVHPTLIRLGFLEVVDQRRLREGDDAQLFPLLRAGPHGGYGEAWSKWFGRYIRGLGVKRAVFHSFRHSMKDALREAAMGEDINDALTGHAGGGTGRAYGAKQMGRRFGIPTLAAAIAKIEYVGLDLSHLSE